MISADNTPNSTDSHQIGPYEPNLSNTIPPSRTPRKPPTSALVAVMFGTRWFSTLFGFAFVSHQVGGTVDSQVRPMAAPNMMAETGVIGNEMNRTIDSARAK